MNSLKIIK